MKKDYEALNVIVVRIGNADLIRTSGEGGFMVEEQLFSTDVHDPNN